MAPWLLSYPASFKLARGYNEEDTFSHYRFCPRLAYAGNGPAMGQSADAQGRNSGQVQGHYGTDPDGNPYNNWSYPGNVNPYTGKQATRDPSRYLGQYQNRNGYDPYSNNPTTYNPYTAYRW